MAEALVDAGDEPLADVAREVEVDVGQRGELLVQEAPDEQLVGDRVDVRETRQVADDRGDARPPPATGREECAGGFRPPDLDRDLAPLEFGLRITTLVRDTTEEAWHDAEQRVAEMAERSGQQADRRLDRHGGPAVGQQRLLDLAAQGDVLDSCLYTAPGRFGGGGAGTTWLVGSAEDVANALQKYADLGVTHFVLSDTPYKQEIVRVGDALLPLLRERELAPAVS